MGKKLFCEINPLCYNISMEKEILKRHIKNFVEREKIAVVKSRERLPNLVSEHKSCMIKRAPGVNLTHQLNKADNIKLAGSRINGVIIKPGEVFSFWKLVGRTTKRAGYKEGRIIKNNRLISGIGGGLCNLSNTIHLLVLDSPLKVVEFHKHSDALAPDEGKRVPFSAGTSVCYNHIDFRFKNTTEQSFQILIWTEGEELRAELRSEEALPVRYELYEEDHHFKKENEKFYRNSKIYRKHIDVSTGDIIERELILDNHSEVMFDYSLIPEELIKI